MGFYIRKSKSVGPFRLNLSKSGLGVSTGVKGARLSVGPRGTYINLGRNGLYYRKKIGSSSKKGSSNVQRSNSSYPTENTYTQTDTIRVAPANHNASDLNNGIVKDIKRASILFWIWLVLCFILPVAVDWWTIIPLVLFRVIFFKLFNARINYDLDSDASLEWEKYSEIIKLLKSCKKVWIVQTAIRSNDAKYNAGATRNITRGKASVKWIKKNRATGFRVKTNANSIAITSGKCSILFLPSEVIIKKGFTYAVYSYDELTAYSSTTNFIETDRVPRDATIARYTWQYVNRDGSRDMRFNKNRQIPVCQYGKVHFISGQDLSIELHTSNWRVAESVGNAFTHYADFVVLSGLATDEIEESAVVSETDEDEIPPAPVLPDRIETVASEGVSLFDDRKNEQSASHVEDVYSDLFPEDDAENDDSLINDMAMFLNEE